MSRRLKLIGVVAMIVVVLLGALAYLDYKTKQETKQNLREILIEKTYNKSGDSATKDSSFQ